MRECNESDFSHKPFILEQYRTLGYFDPILCFDNVEDMYLSGSDSTYDEPRGWIKIDFKECRTEDHCEKDQVKRRNFINNLHVTLSIFEDQIDFKNHEGTEPTFSFRKFENLINFNNYDGQFNDYWLKLQENEYETYDSWFPQWTPSFKGNFYRHI